MGLTRRLKRLSPPAVRKARWGIHEKTLIVDEKNTAIGTFNVGPRSKALNVEGVLYVPANPAIAHDVEASVRARMEKIQPLLIIPSKNWRDP